MEYIGQIQYDEKFIGKKIIICGTGKCGEKIFRYLHNNGLQDQILGFCVSEIEGKSHTFCNKEVKTVEDMVVKYPEADYLIAGKYMREMFKELQKRNIHNVHLLFL